MSSNTIVCHQDIIQTIKHFPNITSDQLAAKLPMGTRIQDVLLEMVKDSICKCEDCGARVDPLENFNYEGREVCRDCFIQLIPQESRDMFLNPSQEGGIPWEVGT